MCRGPRSRPYMFFCWWFSLLKPPLVQVSWLSWSSCRVSIPFRTCNPSPNFFFFCQLSPFILFFIFFILIRYFLHLHLLSQKSPIPHPLPYPPTPTGYTNRTQHFAAYSKPISGKKTETSTTLSRVSKFHPLFGYRSPHWSEPGAMWSLSEDSHKTPVCKHNRVSLIVSEIGTCLWNGSLFEHVIACPFS